MVHSYDKNPMTPQQPLIHTNKCVINLSITIVTESL